MTKQLTTKNILSISGHNQTNVITQLTKALQKSDYQSACLWSVEMHISGWIKKWWLTIVSYSSNFIYISNPKISKFLWKIYTENPELLGVGNVNSTEIRQCIALVVGVCCFSQKDIKIQIPKAILLNNNEHIEIIDSIFNSGIDSIVNKVSIQNDSILMIKLLSKLSKNIRNMNYSSCLKVISICLYLEKHKLSKKKIICGFRTWKGLNRENWTHWTFFVWDILVALSETQNKEVNEIICSWRGLYIVNSNHSKPNKLISYIINAILLLVNKSNLSISCINNEEMIQKGIKNVDLIYGNILKQYCIFNNAN